MCLWTDIRDFAFGILHSGFCVRDDCLDVKSTVTRRQATHPIHIGKLSNRRWNNMYAFLCFFKSRLASRISTRLENLDSPRESRREIKILNELGIIHTCLQLFLIKPALFRCTKNFLGTRRCVPSRLGFGRMFSCRPAPDAPDSPSIESPYFSSDFLYLRTFGRR